jgi:hypothetical protein
MAIFKLSEFSQEDLGLYFRGTILRLILPPDGRIQWVEYHGRGDAAQHEFYIGGQRRTKAAWLRLEHAELAKYSVDIRFPFGYFNTRQSVVFCERVGARQNLKGLSSKGNFSMKAIEWQLPLMEASPSVQRGLTLSAARVDRNDALTPDIANLLFERQRYFSLVEAAVQIRSRKVFARALSSHIALVPHYEHKDFLVLYHGTPVAEYYSKAHKMKILASTFRPELLPLCASEGATINE